MDQQVKKERADYNTMAESTKEDWEIIGSYAMDFNADGRLNIADGISGLNYLFLGGPPPPAGIGCKSYPDCESDAACL